MKKPIKDVRFNIKHFLICVIFFLIGEIGLAQNINLTLADQLTYSGQQLSNIWGWKDPQDGKEYALVGAQNGLSVVDISNPAAVFQVVQIPGPSCNWREIKTVGNYAYIASECGSIGLQIVDLINLPATNLTTATWTPTINSQQLTTIHALHADNGKVYLYGTDVGNGGCIVADVITTPMAPVYLGSYDPRYVHDGYVRNDTLYAGHIYDGEVAIVNLSNPNNQIPMATFNTPTNFTHNTWLSQNSKTCFTTDENNGSYLGAFDISNLGNITELDRIQSNPGSNSIVHNTHIINVGGNDYAVTSWNKDGITIVDASRPSNLVQVGNYDTSPLSGGGYGGCWGVYPFFSSGTIVASDRQDGLFVFTPTYVRASYVEGVVTDCITGNPLSGTLVQIVNPPAYSVNSSSDITDAFGKYGVGVVAAGTYTVTFSKTNYITQTFTVAVTSGNVTIQNVQLCTGTASFSYTGMVLDNASTLGIPNADVRIQDASTSWNAVTNASGNFTIPNMLAGSYEVIAGKWGYVTKCFANQNINQTSGALSVLLDAGIYDDFTWNWGWTVNSTASDGFWERGDPLGTTNGPTPANPGFDVTNDCSVEAYVTGNTGTSTYDDDVDGGSTNLLSPVFDLSSYLQPYLFYSRWHVFSGNPQNDSLRIFINNGSTSVLVEGVNGASPNSATWVNSSFNLAGLISLTSTMTVRVRAREGTTTHLVECGFDKFYIVDSGTVAVNHISFADGSVIVYPNPFSASTTIQVQSLKSLVFSLSIYDIYGKTVRSMQLERQSTKLERGDLASGMYFYKVTDGENTIGTGKFVVE